MSIISKTGQISETITEGWRALTLFTNRRGGIRLFCSYLNDDPSSRILFFYGDGGNGKSLLLRFLREYYCKRLRPENWEWIKQKPDDEFLAEMKDAEGADPVPFATLDFGMKPVGDDRPQEAFSGLLMLRRGLAGHKLSFPLFDFACIWYLHKTSKLTQDRLESLFPAEELDLLKEIVDAISQNTWVSLGRAVLGVFNKRSSNWFTLYKQRRNLDAEQVTAIQRMDPETELLDRLPSLFAEDLNVAMSFEDSPPRVLLLFDTHEAFWGSQRNVSDDLFFQRDEWLRRLLGSLETSSGIVAVLAGRDRPRWAEARRYFIPTGNVECFLVGHFRRADAELFLERAGIADSKMRLALVSYAQAESDQIHPLYLGLCADVVLAAAEQGHSLTPEDFPAVPQAADKGAYLVDRLLRYVDQEIGFAVRALAACRAFDRNLYLKIGEYLKFQATEPAFEVLSRFSFVWRAEQRGEGWYRIHSLLRRLMGERQDEVTRRAHEALEKYYIELGQAGDVINAINTVYHMNRLDWERGVDNWISLFESGLRVSQYDMCRALLELRRELFIETDFYLARVSALEADFFSLLYSYDEAKQGYLDAIDAYDRALVLEPDIHSIINKGSVLESLGALQKSLSKSEEGVESYSKSIAVFDEALRLEPANPAAHTNKGNALLGLGLLQIGLSEHAAALESINKAVAEYDESLLSGPDNVTTLSNKGVALQNVGELQSKLAQHDLAIESYRKAIATLEEALQLSPDLIDAHLNKGTALFRLGEVQADLSLFEEAIGNYKESLASYDEVFQRAPNHIDAFNNKGTVLRLLGELQMKLSKYQAAFTSYQESIAAFDELLKRAPEHIPAYLNKGNSLQGLGDVQAEVSQYEAAIKSYLAATTTYDEILRRAPDDIAAYNNKATVLRSLGELQFRFGQDHEALESYEKALASLEEVFRRAPGSISAYNNKGGILLRLGELQSHLEQYETAIATYRKAIVVFDEVLRRAPDYIDAHQNKGNVLVSIGELHAGLSEFDLSVTSYQEAVAAYDKVLEYAPENVLSYNNKGSTLRSLGNSYSKSLNDAEAVLSYVAAVAACDEALRRSPDYAVAYLNKGSALHSHATLMFARERHADAIDYCKAAIAACDEALKRAPDNAIIHSKKGHVYGLMSMSQINLSEQSEAAQSLIAAVTALTKSLAIAPGNEGDRYLREELLNTLRKAGLVS